MNFKGKKILILGLKRSGLAVAKLLLNNNAELTLCDSDNSEKMKQSLTYFSDYNCKICLGENVINILEGHDILLISPGVPINSPVVIKAKQLDIQVLGELEIAFCFAKSEVIAVTGTNGKTTSVSLLGRIFENMGKRVFVAGNIGYPLSSAVMEAEGQDKVIAEVSSFQLETIEKFHPSIAALLNITEDHLNRHGTIEEYISLKMRIFENQSKNDYAILNYDDKIIRENSSKIKAHKIWFSRLNQVDEGVFVKDGKITAKLEGKEFSICDVDLVKIPGPHNLENALAMTAISIVSDVPRAVIRHSLQTFEGVEHRIEFVKKVNGITYINDSKGTNCDSTIKAVATMKEPTVIVLGGYDKHTDFSQLCQRIKSSKYVFHAVLLGQTSQQIKESLEAVGFKDVSMANSLEDAVKKASKIAIEGNNVLLSPACASFDMFSDYEQRGKIFKEIVNNLE